jgi:hypothetical protein
MTILRTDSPKLRDGEDTGALKLVVSFVGRGQHGLESREDEPTNRRHGRSIRTRVERDGRPESLPSIFVSQGESSPMLKPLMLSLSLALAVGMCGISKAGGYDQNCSTCGLASPQAVVASAQGSVPCDTSCPPKKCHFNFHLPKLHCHLPKLHHEVCYEWVLKKKHKWNFHHESCNDGCGTGVYPTGQVTAAPSGQSSSQAFGAAQHTFQVTKPAPSIASVPTEIGPAVPGDEAPPAPEVRETSALGAQNAGLLLPTPSGN